MQVAQTNLMEVNLVLLETIAIIIVTKTMIAIITMITMIVIIETIIVTMMIVETIVMRTTMMKRSIASTQIVVMIVTIILMANEQMTSRQCMLIAASRAPKAMIAPLDVPLILPAMDQTTDITCQAVALVVPQVAALFLTIRLIVRTLACIPTVLQATPTMMPINLATSLRVSCLVAKKWLMIPS